MIRRCRSCRRRLIERVWGQPAECEVMPCHGPKGTALVPVVRATCPACQLPLADQTVVEVPLFAHGGYGAARATTMRWCPCGWRQRPDVTEINPRPYRQGAA